MNLEKIQEKIREAAKNCLQSGEVEMLIGYGKGTLKNRTAPLFIAKPEDASRLVYNQYCSNNLITYLKKYKPAEGKKIGVITKGCDNRTLISMIKENQIERSKIFIIGVESYGIYIEKPDGGGEQLDPNCITCQTHKPITYDVLIEADDDIKKQFAELPEKPITDEEIEAFDKMQPAERWKFFQKEVERCIRCYACRNACPLCYCAECFVDSSAPKWMNEGFNPTDLTFYHIVRMLHAAGRCGECGACERACPMNIRLKFLTRKMNSLIEEFFGAKSGLNPEAPPAFGTFKEDDNNSIFK